MEQQLYIRIRGKVQGPLGYEKLQALARRGQFSRLHEVSEDGANWVRASNYPDLFSGLTVVPANRATAPLPAKPAARADEGADTYAMTQHDDDQVGAEDSPPISPREQSWYYSVGSTQQGPVGFAMLQMLASTGQLAQDDLVWSDGMQEWTAAGRVPGLARSAAAPSAAMSVPAPASAGALPRASGLAIASLILGILGLLPLFGVGSLIAVIFGHVSLSAIHRSNGLLTGGGMAVAGLILGYLVVVPIIAYLLFMLVLVIVAAITAGAGAAAA